MQLFAKNLRNICSREACYSVFYGRVPVFDTMSVPYCISLIILSKFFLRKWTLKALSLAVFRYDHNVKRSNLIAKKNKIIYSFSAVARAQIKRIGLALVIWKTIKLIGVARSALLKKNKGMVRSVKGSFCKGKKLKTVKTLDAVRFLFLTVKRYSNANVISKNLLRAINERRYCMVRTRCKIRTPRI